MRVMKSKWWRDDNKVILLIPLLLVVVFYLTSDFIKGFLLGIAFIIVCELYILKSKLSATKVSREEVLTSLHLPSQNGDNTSNIKSSSSLKEQNAVLSGKSDKLTEKIKGPSNTTLNKFYVKHYEMTESEVINYIERMNKIEYSISDVIVTCKEIQDAKIKYR